ncbi:hypothetical protein KZ483_09430 [Paenibacillus sp. sptzw28]|uniref:hypothetical protein n=1 Tax=Paenibacillus sp. sptzw28 TaxID=715179 RepID=UPI001C6E28A5|nr:hypothetical protein [Paenibacillus sp. sptzw28]QYR23112.1 hypothetical protein KZ483_09430 [Paenibacillus sp. sptzw28]
MPEHNQRNEQDNATPQTEQRVKIVAEMPEDQEMRDNLEELQENDGYPGSCGL